MKRRITLVAGLHLTSTDKQYINAILDAGEKTGHRKGGLRVSLEKADRQVEIDRCRSSQFHHGWADAIEKYVTRGVLYIVMIEDQDRRITRQIIDAVEI